MPYTCDSGCCVFYLLGAGVLRGHVRLKRVLYGTGTMFSRTGGGAVSRCPAHRSNKEGVVCYDYLSLSAILNFEEPAGCVQPINIFALQFAVGIVVLVVSVLDGLCLCIALLCCHLRHALGDYPHVMSPCCLWPVFGPAALLASDGCTMQSGEKGVDLWLSVPKSLSNCLLNDFVNCHDIVNNTIYNQLAQCCCSCTHSSPCKMLRC